MSDPNEIEVKKDNTMNFLDEISDILRAVYRNAFKPLLIYTLSAVVIISMIYFVWYLFSSTVLLIVCNIPLIQYVPYVSRVCPQDSTSSSSVDISSAIAPLFAITGDLGKILSETDVSTRIKLTEIIIPLIELKPNLKYSSIDENMQKILLDQLNELENSVQLTTENFHTMLTVFNSALKKLFIYTQMLLPLTSTQHHQISTDVDSGNETTALMVAIEQNELTTYLQRIDDEAEKIIKIVEIVHGQLIDIQGKVGVLSETTAIPSKKNRHELDAIEHAAIFSLPQLYRKTFGNGNIDKIKYQRNLNILAGFDNFTHMALINTVYILDKVRDFKTESKQLKADTCEMLNVKQDNLKSLKIQMQILLNVLERLKQSKEHFEGRLDKTRRIDNKSEL